MLKLKTLASAIAVSGAQAALAMTTTPFLAGESAIAMFVPSSDFAGTVVLQKSLDDGENYTTVATFTRNTVSRALSSAGLAEGTNANTIQIAAPNGAGVDYMINGVLYHKADTNNIAMTALAAQAADTYAKYLVSLDAAGTVTLTKGADAASSALALLPATPANQAAIGYIEVQTTGVTFTSGTTDLSAAGITDTYVNLFDNTEESVVTAVPLNVSEVELADLMRANGTTVTNGSYSLYLLSGS